MNCSRGAGRDQEFVSSTNNQELLGIYVELEFQLVLHAWHHPGKVEAFKRK